ncbi:MAG: Xaa-Pro peptidase family protein [Actinomycetota bacterium]|nr:Xaa-Pro peptidase family protein [Actinomycetota bacterium]
MDHSGRVAKLRGRLGAAGVDGVLITNLTNVRYLSGFSGSNGAMLVTEDGATFFSDPRYRARAADLVQGADVVIYRDRLTDELTDRLASAHIAKLGVEAAAVTLAQEKKLAERLPEVELVPVDDLVEDLRRIKEPSELELIRRAVELADQGFDWVTENVAPGMTEVEVALELEVMMRKAGAEDVSFEPIVGSGPLTAHIHHSPSDRTLDKGDLVLLDFGARVDGYCSDLTRTVVLGPATDEQREMYELVLRAQAAGIEAARPGTKCADVDAAARDIIEAAGRADEFGHGLGHGVGLDIHEEPAFSRISEDSLQGGEVMTVEPGVYVIGTGGIRIEDDIVIDSSGATVLGSAPKDLLIEL